MGRSKAMYSPLTVATVAKQLMVQGLIKFEPVWYQPVLNAPPMTDFSRKPSQAHQGRKANSSVDIRKIQPIQRGLEVHFRRKFYKQHPWELARPRIAVEDDGADYSRMDWSKMEQIGKPLDGER
jgi:small subunit ribosomal protein S23